MSLLLELGTNLCGSSSLKVIDLNNLPMVISSATLAWHQFRTSPAHSPDALTVVPRRLAVDLTMIPSRESRSSG